MHFSFFLNIPLTLQKPVGKPIVAIDLALCQRGLLLGQDLFKVLPLDFRGLEVPLECLNGRLVAQIAQIRSRIAFGEGGYRLEIHILMERHPLAMEAEKGQSGFCIWSRDMDELVKASGSQQGVVNHVGTIGGRHNEYMLLAAAGHDAIHFGEQGGENPQLNLATPAATRDCSSSHKGIW